ncbi:MAG: outer membrane beta-barrel domain-containing protein [Desulfobacteraceae bacterium]|nr:MAG: outer membrane beta-barrel domain-containing protein [Desulfobacteraceae bacterium]
MRTRKRLSVVAFLFFFVLCAGYGNAEILSEALTISPFLGNYHFEGNQDIEDRMTFGLGIGYNIDKNWAVEAVGNMVSTETDPGAADIDVRLLKMEGLYHFTSGNHPDLVPYLGAGLGGFNFSPDEWSGDAGMFVNYGGGVKYFFNDTVGLRGDIRHIISFNDQYNNLMYTVGLVFQMGGRKKSVEKTVIEPVPVKVEEPVQEPVSTTAAVRDSDGDGIADDADKCEKTPKGVKVDAWGCPLDQDGDGVADFLDKCPNTPVGAPVDPNGCPLDTDADGVADYLDKCENTPAGASVDSRGCWVIQGIQFVSGKSDITPEFYPVLDQVLSVLRNEPDLKVEIQGYTDSKGALALNQRLSEDRATRIMQYFIDNGVDARNLSAKGFGPSNPAATNDTPEGRAQNRRVELKPVW